MRVAKNPVSPDELRRITNVNESYYRSLLLLGVGVVLLSLGGMMVTNLYTWQLFSVWLPLVLIVSGLLLLGSKRYSTSMGFLFLAIGGAFWLHQVGVSSFSYLTAVIDWLFVIVGGAIVVLALARLMTKDE